MGYNFRMKIVFLSLKIVTVLANRTDPFNVNTVYQSTYLGATGINVLNVFHAHLK